MAIYKRLLIRWLSGLLLLIVSVASNSEQRLISHKSPDIDVYLYNENCPNTGVANIELRSPQASNFDKNRVDITSVINTVQSIVKFNCPNVKRMTIRGKSNGVLYFAGVSAKQDAWQLVSLYAPPR